MEKLLRRFYLFLTELLYHQFAWAYDWVASIVSAGLWQEWVLSIRPDLSGSVLELGHGPGHLQKSLLQKGVFVVGLDKSPQMSRQAKKRLHQAHLAFSLVYGDASQLPFGDKTFDRVVATFPSNYIVKHDTLAEVYRILRPGGGLVVLPGARIVTPNGLPGKLATGIFRLFGLSSGWGTAPQAWFEEPMRGAGFDVITQRRRLQSSEVFVILATKKR